MADREANLEIFCEDLSFKTLPLEALCLWIGHILQMLACSTLGIYADPGLLPHGDDLSCNGDVTGGNDVSDRRLVVRSSVMLGLQALHLACSLGKAGKQQLPAFAQAAYDSSIGEAVEHGKQPSHYAFYSTPVNVSPCQGARLIRLPAASVGLGVTQREREPRSPESAREAFPAHHSTYY